MLMVRVIQSWLLHELLRNITSNWAHQRQFMINIFLVSCGRGQTDTQTHTHRTVAAKYNTWCSASDGWRAGNNDNCYIWYAHFSKTAVRRRMASV